MTYKQTRDGFIEALMTNAYINMCNTDDMANAIKALDKQIPEKVKDGTCPNCFRIFLFRHGEKRKGDYCDNCGKALIWED
ncbi:MAG: hypothetical protein II304_12145 [Bacteroidales bacterium]|nr:hypothetical protein [Bacteroidales bacterium]